MAIITTSRGEILALSARVQEVASTLDDVLQELVLPPADLPDEHPAMVQVSPELIEGAGKALLDVHHSMEELIQHYGDALPPGPGEDLLPVSGSHLGNIPLSRSLAVVRRHVTTYQQLASLNESTVREWNRVGTKGLDALKDLLAQKGLRFDGL